ncbi:hypothetical protein LOY42_09190 [Pseudomonas sp. B21-023]|uniref:NAD(P)-dependent oxidoreductase n=1 Tax=unclassified Pseudomonas TaxID=196821 RepID=UPI00111A58C7|nr:MULTISPECIES: NAD(P)-dependent oxidoreductase [unclassified Pseudomonas]UVM18449.1 hypothetical protein LOY42_09190 [Pseudomonas sp. B21-023]
MASWTGRSLGARVSKDTLFEQADIATLHRVLSERSRNIVGRAELQRMKPHAWLINTARSGLVDQQALLSALQAGQIAFEDRSLLTTDPVRPVCRRWLPRGASKAAESWWKGLPVGRLFVGNASDEPSRFARRSLHHDLVPFLFLQ